MVWLVVCDQPSQRWCIDLTTVHAGTGTTKPIPIQIQILQMKFELHEKQI